MRLSADPRVHLSTGALATELVVSRNHLHKIVRFLTELGLVRTIRGAHGGVMLARPANKIRVGEVIQGYEQDQALVECFRADGGACTLLPRCRLRGMLAAAKSVFYQYLNQYTLADCHLAGSNLSIRSKGKQRRPLDSKKLNIRSPRRSSAVANRKS
jgi:Rrf2 family nitric oxide-sensitive transcriptional repressor